MRIAVFTKNRTNPAYGSARLGVDRVASRHGATADHYVPEKPDDPKEQSALIDRALATRPDAIVISPVHPTQVDDALLRIAAARVPMVAFINRVTVAPTVSYVGSDDAALGREIAGYLFRHLEGQGRVLVVTGPAHSPTSQDRLRGFREAAAKAPRIEFAGQVVGDYSRATAKARAAEWLREHDAPAACLCANDVMAIGVLEALDDAGRRSVVVGVNAIPEAIAAIAQGRMLATVDFNAMQIAALATECAIRHLCGERVPESIELPARVVDRTNWKDWDQPYEMRPLLGLDELENR